jgi:uncharacterized protein YjbI with pentapeptide repeats
MTDDDIPDKPSGRSFRGQSLEGADFSGKDLRGTDFTGADLRSARFREVKLGVAPNVGALFLGIAMLITIAAGVAIGWVVDEIRVQMNGDRWDEAASGGSLIFVLLVFVGLIVWRGFDAAVKVIVVVYLVVLAGNIIANFVWDDVNWYRALRGTFLLLVLFLAILAGILGRVVGGVFGIWSVVLVAILGGLATGQAQGGIAGVIVAVSLAVISKRAVRGDQRDRTLRRLAHRLVARWGTRFNNADLTGADFTGTHTSRCGVKGATLDDVVWDPDEPLPLDLPDDAIPAGR